MANQTVTADEIIVHGRGSLVLPFEVKNAAGQQLDISNKVLFFEVDGVPIREQLEANPGDPQGLLIKLERDQIALLSPNSLKTKKFAVIDETLAADGIYIVLWSGVISREGYVGDPDQLDEA